MPLGLLKIIFFIILFYIYNNGVELIKDSYLYNLSLARNFFTVYYPVRYLDTYATRKFYLGDSKDKKCRFCNGTEADVTFNKDAHVIAQLLGNIFTLSNFECDNCNAIFGKYESDLARYLGPIRALGSFMDNKKRNPIFQHEDRSLKINREDNMVYVEGLVNEQPEEKIVTIPFSTQRFIPIHIYKSLVKMAFCLLDQEEKKLFNEVPEFLLTTNLDKDIRVMSNARLSSYLLRQGLSSPIAYLFKKKSSIINHPATEYVFVLYFYQCVYQISLPLSINDKWIYESKKEVEIITHNSPVLIINETQYYMINEFQKNNPFDLSSSQSTTTNDELVMSYKGKYKDSELENFKNSINRA